MKIDTEEFRVKAKETVSLKKRPTDLEPFYRSREEYQELLNEQIERLSAMQGLLYANNSYSVLLNFQFFSGLSIRSRKRLRCSSLETCR